MKNPLRRTLATLALAAATITGLATAGVDLNTETPADTTWGAADTPTPPAEPTLPTETPATPLDTTWG